MFRLSSVAKRLLPKTWVQRVAQFKAQRVYERTRRSYDLKKRPPEFDSAAASSLEPSVAGSLLFVCFGNIMRSPMCEALMKRAMSDRGNLNVISAGLNADPGRRAHPWAVSAAAELGISLEGHRARALTCEMVEQADLIFAMDFHNRMEILSRFPHSIAKVFMLGEFRGSGEVEIEIPDPYHLGEEATRHCYRVLNTCIRNLALGMARQTKSPSAV